MTTDHQVTKHDSDETAYGPGVIVAALIVLATLAVVVWLVMH